MTDVKSLEQVLLIVTWKPIKGIQDGSPP